MERDHADWIPVDLADLIAVIESQVLALPLRLIVVYSYACKAIFQCMFACSLVGWVPPGLLELGVRA